MRATDFVATYAKRGIAAWERAALDMIARGKIAYPPILDVPVETTDGRHRGVFHAAGDYLAIGEEGDFMRLPLLPRSAQLAADQFAVLLPTAKMVDAIWRAAPVKLAVGGERPNLGANLAQYLAHSRKVDAALAAAGAGSLPSAGSMKDVIVARTIPGDRGPRPVRPAKVVIYGWHGPDGRKVQGKSDVHGDSYVDYSHGVRLISPNMTVDGRSTTVAEVLRDPELWSMLSDEGPIPPSSGRSNGGFDSPGYPLGEPGRGNPLLAMFDGDRYARGLNLWTDQLFGRTT